MGVLKCFNAFSVMNVNSSKIRIWGKQFYTTAATERFYKTYICLGLFLFSILESRISYLMLLGYTIVFFVLGLSTFWVIL